MGEGEFYFGFPVIYSPLVPDGHVMFLGDREAVVFSIPPKPKRRWWQRQRTVDARHAQAVIRSQRNITDLLRSRPTHPHKGGE